MRTRISDPTMTSSPDCRSGSALERSGWKDGLRAVVAAQLNFMYVSQDMLQRDDRRYILWSDGFPLLIPFGGVSSLFGKVPLWTRMGRSA